jgi:hypothetical protein
VTYYSFFILFTTGGNSLKSSGSIRTIQGFSTATKIGGGVTVPKLAGEKWFEIYNSYHSSSTYADDFTKSACQGTGVFEPKAAVENVSPVITTISQGEGCMKGAQYQNMPMYVIHEMEAAIADCKAGTVGTHWDEAFAFYTGSLVSNGRPADKGVLQYGLAEKRASDFNTQNSDNSAVVNEKVLALFVAGRNSVPKFQCEAMEATKEALVKQFTIPLVQGVMKYLYLADNSDRSGAKPEKEKVYIYIWKQMSIYVYTCT